jgi:hypothetical protein
LILGPERVVWGASAVGDELLRVGGGAAVGGGGVGGEVTDGSTVPPIAPGPPDGVSLGMLISVVDIFTLVVNDVEAELNVAAG